VNANAYRCLECGLVDSDYDVEVIGRGQWLSVEGVSVVIVNESGRLPSPALFCGPDCALAGIAKIKRIRKVS
jgi:hypothetical protein